MTETGDTSLLDSIIQNQRLSVRYFEVLALVLLIVGIILLFVGFLMSKQIASDLFVKLLGIFVSSLSGVPTVDFVNRKAKIQMLDGLRVRMVGMDSQGIAEKEQIQALVWKVVEKTVLGVN